MPGQDLIQTNQRLDFGKGGIPAFLTSDVIAGGKEVAGIQTNPEALRAAHALINPRQVLELVAEATPLPGSVLQSNANRRMLCGLEHIVKSGEDLLNPGV